MPAVARYLIDHDPESLSTLAEFIDANETLTAEQVSAIAALQPGETYAAGGGAGAEWTVTRVAEVDPLADTATDWDLPEAAPAPERPAPTDEEIDAAADRAARGAW